MKKLKLIILIMTASIASITLLGAYKTPSLQANLKNKSQLKLEGLLLDIKNGRIPLEPLAILSHLESLRHEEIKKLLDTLSEDVAFEALSESLRRKIMFVSFTTPRKIDAHKSPEEFLTEPPIRLFDEFSQVTCFDQDAKKFYQCFALENPEKYEFHAAVYKYSKKEPFYKHKKVSINGWSLSWYCYCDIPQKTSLHIPEYILKSDSDSTSWIEAHRLLMGAKFEKPIKFLENCFGLLFKIQKSKDYCMTEYRNYCLKTKLSWAIRDLAQSEGGSLSKESSLFIASQLREVSNEHIQKDIMSLLKPYLEWSPDLHPAFYPFFPAEKKALIKTVLLCANRSNTVSKDIFIKTLETIFLVRPSYAPV